MNLFDPLLDLIYPIFCYGCGKWGTYLCPSCAKTIQTYDLPICPGCMSAIATIGVHTKCAKLTALDGLLVSAQFTGILKTMIAEAKYKGYFDLYHTLSLLFPKDTVKKLRPRILIPIPMHEKKLDERGFNQSLILAQDLSAQTGVPTSDKLLFKTVETTSQASLSREKRLKNVSGSFSCPYKLKKTDCIMLIDDVVTTGSTFSAAALTLKKAGAGKIYGVALAHGH